MRVGKVSFIPALLLAVAVLFAPSISRAQSASYVDESGTIHFVDRLDQVPDKYKSQVLKVKPVPLSKKEYKAELVRWKKKQAEEKKNILKKEKEKEKERKKMEKELKKRDKHRPKGKSGGSSSQQGQLHTGLSDAATPAPIVR